MIYRKLYHVVVVRILLILVNCLLLAFVWGFYKDLLLIINLSIALGIQTYLFIRKLNQINLDLENFFKAIRNNDTTTTFRSKYQGKQYDELYAQFDLISKDIRAVKIQNESSNQYFKVLVEHVGIGLISFDEKGKISLFNRTAKEIFNKPYLFHIRELDRIQEGISNMIVDLQPSEQKLISLYRNHELIQLSIKASEIKTDQSNVKLVSFQNIKNELDEKELDSWQKLIRVLTHEIMNSVSPVNSSISTLVDFFKDETSGQPVSKEMLSSEIIQDTLTGLEIIDERIRGMIDFVVRFRDLTLMPKPNFQQLNLVERVKNLTKLLSEKMRREEIEFSIIYSCNEINIQGDPVLVDQILINLITNSIQALDQCSKKKIAIYVDTNERNKAFINVVDNGGGIEKELQGEIFVPFFTTKTEGSGVGLSLSRQLMQMHGGTISFKSEPHVRTEFCLQF